MKKILLILLIIVFPIQSNAQSETEYLLYNVSFGGIVSGIGSIINKKEDEKTGKAFLKGFAGGALGGYVSFESKRVLNLAQENADWKLIWSSKILNAMGTSIKENAALNRELFNYWHINFGFSRIELNYENKFRLKHKILPISFLFVSRAFIYEKFDLERTLEFGELFFWSKTIDNRGFYFPGYIGLNYNIFMDGNIPYSLRKPEIYKTATHEIVHSYQSNDFQNLNNLYNHKINNFYNKKNMGFIEKYFYIEYHFLPLRILYNSEKERSNNFFEKEASFWTNTN